jgi:octaprenyl-diphosphate synthase
VTSPAPPSAEPAELPLDLLVSQTIGEDLTARLSELLPLLVRDLADIDRRIQDVLGATYPRLTDAAKYACSAGGKRVRPVLMAALHRALGATDTGPIQSLAAAFQLIHTATLVHDDVIDHAEMRRGRPSLPQAFGLPLAIVSGDYLFVRAFELASEYPRSIIMRCGEACADLVEGEVLQESGRFDLTAGREHYFRVVERKTAAIVAAALGSVAEIQGAPTQVQDAASGYGRSLGIAFQIRDDLLDVYGDSDILGKPLYGDFREGNPTLLSLETYETLDGARRAEFERLFGLRRKSPGDLLRLRALVDASGASGRVADTARQWAERASRSLEALPPSPFRILLEHMAWGAAERRF